MNQIKPLKPSERFEAWTPQWYNAIGNSKTTKWHLQSLVEISGLGRITGPVLDEWIQDGKNKSENYIGPRLTLAAKIAHITLGVRFTTYAKLEWRKITWIKKKVQEKENSI